MFGYTKPNANNLLQEHTKNMLTKIIPIAEKNRKNSQLKVNKGKENSRSYKNWTKTDKTFENPNTQAPTSSWILTQIDHQSP